MVLPITEIIWGASAVVVLICGVRIYQAYRKKGDKMLKDFALFFFLTGFGFVGMALSDPLIPNEFYSKLALTAGLFVMFIGIAFLAKLAMGLTYPRLEKPAFWLVMAGNALTVFVNVKKYLLVPTRTPFIHPETGVFVVNLPVAVAGLIMLMSVAVLITPGIIFIRRALKLKNPEIRTKALLIGLGLGLFGMGGMACGVSNIVGPMTSVQVRLISDLFVAIAVFALFCGTFYVIEKRVPKTIPSVKAIPAAVPRIKW